MQPNQANIAAMGQTARASATLQGAKTGGPLGVVPQATPPAEVGGPNAQQATANPGANPNLQGMASGQATGLIAGQMMTRRL